MPRPSQRAIGLTAAGLGGVGVAVQSKINGELGERLHDGYVAALISFGGGLILIGVITGLQPAGRHGIVRLRAAVGRGGISGRGAISGSDDISGRDGISLWQCLGGAFGALLVAAQGLTVATLGVALFTVAVVAGQSLSSLAVDRVGLGTSGPQPLTNRRLLGAGLTVVAVIIAVADRFGAPSALALAILPTVAGAGSAVQQAINGRVRAAASNVAAATLVNFVVGTTVLVIAVAVDLVARGRPTGAYPREPWLYAGGALGVVFIAIAAAVVHEIGVLLLGLCMVAGQLIGSVGIDAITPGGGHLSINTLVGVALTLIAVVIAATPTAQARPNPVDPGVS